MDESGYIGYRLYTFELLCLPAKAEYLDLSSYLDDEEEIDFNSFVNFLRIYE